MKRAARHILTALLALTLLLPFSCKRASVIPRGKLADIYADMFMADQWLRSDYKYRRMADTLLVYEPIFESYGYTTDDYLLTVQEYMKDPDRFSRILKKAAKKLEKEAARLQKDLDKIRYSRDSRNEIYEWMKEVVSNSVLDSLTFSSFVKPPSDTSWEGVRMIIDSTWRVEADSLARADSLALADSLSRADSLAQADSVARADTMVRKVFPKEARVSGDSVETRKERAVRQLNEVQNRVK